MTSDSDRALEAFDSIPADSEAEKDYETGPAKVDSLLTVAQGRPYPDFAEVRMVVDIPGEMEFEVSNRVPMDTFDPDKMDHLVGMVADIVKARFR